MSKPQITSMKFVNKEFDEFTDITTLTHKSAIKCGGILMKEGMANIYSFQIRQLITKHGAVVQLVTTIQAEDWFHARDGALMVNCDQENSAVDFRETDTKTEHVGEKLYCFENGIYTIPSEVFSAMCECSTLKMRIRGAAFHEEFNAKWCSKFQEYCRQFFNNAIDQSKYFEQGGSRAPIKETKGAEAGDKSEKTGKELNAEVKNSKIQTAGQWLAFAVFTFAIIRACGGIPEFIGGHSSPASKSTAVTAQVPVAAPLTPPPTVGDASKPTMQFQYETPVELIGTLTERAGEDCCTDGETKNVMFPALELSQPVNVGPGEDASFDPLEQQITLMQLVLTNQENWDAFKQLKGQKARVTCELFHGHNGHHLTDVICGKVTIRPLDIAASQPQVLTPPQTWTQPTSGTWNCSTSKGPWRTIQFFPNGGFKYQIVGTDVDGVGKYQWEGPDKLVMDEVIGEKSLRLSWAVMEQKTVSWIMVNQVGLTVVCRR